MNALVWSMGWVLALLASDSVQVAQAPAADVAVSQAWIRPAPPTAPVRAGYAVLQNHGTTEVVIDAAYSEAFGAIEIHEMHDVDGVMRMRRVPRLVLDAGGAAHLKPGGLHLMLFRPAAALGEGDTATIVFRHEGKDVAQGQFTVRAPE